MQHLKSYLIGALLGAVVLAASFHGFVVWRMAGRLAKAERNIETLATFLQNATKKVPAPQSAPPPPATP